MRIIIQAFLFRAKETQIKQRRERVDKLEDERFGNQRVLVILLRAVVLPFIAVFGHHLINEIEHEDHDTVHHSQCNFHAQVVGIAVAKQQHKHHRHHAARDPDHDKRVNGGRTAGTLEQRELFDPETRHRVVRPLAVELGSRHRFLLKLGHPPLESVARFRAIPKVDKGHAPENHKEAQKGNTRHRQLLRRHLPDKEGGANKCRRNQPFQVKLQEGKVECDWLTKIVTDFRQRAPHPLQRIAVLDPRIVEIIESLLIMQRKDRHQWMLFVQQTVFNLDLSATLVAVGNDRLVDDTQSRLLIEHRLQIVIARQPRIVFVHFLIRVLRILTIHIVPVGNVERLVECVGRNTSRGLCLLLRLSDQSGTTRQGKVARTTNLDTADGINEEIGIAFISPHFEVCLGNAHHQEHERFVTRAVGLHRQLGRFQSLPEIVEDLPIELILRHSVIPLGVVVVIRLILQITLGRLAFLLFAAHIERQHIIPTQRRIACVHRTANGRRPNIAHLLRAEAG
mmetsp:Transcript_47156/g.75552  ORF Transcript_47156/g.75552 Transcript_47156/m.75552 type:complete len:509 (-) Transcript_47156:259-1785(-)